MTNRLARETSPYLLQHASNPVDWYPWSEEALNRAKSEDKPIFLSIGYSACHWCHVMEHESFENDNIAAYLNANYVNIKVDREERPDLDHIYMQTVMALRGGQGGWPLSAFLTPEGHVFFGGTYWPPQARVGMPGFDSVIRQVHQAFVEQRTEIDEQARQVTQWLNDSIQSRPDRDIEIDSRFLTAAASQLYRSFDFENGGFGTAPKFPHPMDLQLLLRMATRAPKTQIPDPQTPSRQQMLEMVDLNLKKMAYGGIHDHLGGGFYRYSVDAEWLIPHFEKMLYDNAQLVRLYTEAFLVTGDPSHLRIAEKTVEYLVRDMLDSAGGFHSSEDADSEGKEGKFYLWTPEEICEVLGDEKGKRFCELYGVTPSGNFEGKNNLNLKQNYESYAEEKNITKAELRSEMQESRSQLLGQRNQRVRPGKDDKILSSWNALALDAIAFYENASADSKVSHLVESNREFALNHLVSQSGRLLHSFRHGETKINAFLDDHAYLINSLCTDSSRLDNVQAATQLAEQMIAQFWDPDQGGFFFTPADQDDVIARYKDHHDGSIPSGNGMAAYALIRLGRLTGDPKWLEYAEKTITWALPFVQKNPLACGQMLLATDLLLAKPLELIIISSTDQDPESKKMMRQIGQTWLPTATLLCGTVDAFRRTDSIQPHVYQGKEAIGGKATLYVCSDYQCQEPINDPEQIQIELRPLVHPS